jgi:hypothetical protein
MLSDPRAAHCLDTVLGGGLCTRGLAAPTMGSERVKGCGVEPGAGVKGIDLRGL